MKLFCNRPMTVLCTVFLCAAAGGFFLFWENGSASLLLTVLACLFPVAAGAVVLLLRRGKRRQAAAAIAAVALAALALMQSYMTFAGRYAAFWASSVQKSVVVEGIVTDRRGSGGYLSSFALTVESVDGREAEGQVILTCHYTADLRPGQVISVRATAVSLEESAGDGYMATALLGDGFAAGLVSESEADITLLGEETHNLRVAAGRLRRTLAARLTHLTKDARGLPAALLLGDRSVLDDAVRRDFARAGVSHLLAISGLHMTLLFGLLDVLLRLLRVPRRARALILCPASIGYLILLGFPPSATRAIIMLGMVYISTLISARADGLTSLSLAGALIVLVNPCTVADAGFWMSYLATFGILALSPLWRAPASGRADDSLIRRLLCKLCRAGFTLGAGLLVGIAAMTFTLVAVASVIGELGVLSPIATLLLTPVCGGVLILSLIALPFFGTAAGDGLGHIIEWLCRLMVDCCAYMGDPAWAVVSLRHPAVLPLAAGALLATVILLSVHLSPRWRWAPVLPALILWVGIGGVTAMGMTTAQELPTVTYLQPSSQSDALVLTAGYESMICDLSNGSLTALRAAMREAEDLGATELSVLMLTHYHSRTATTLGTFLAENKVRTVWAPVPTDAEDYYLLLSYIEKADAAGVPLTVYERGEALTVFGGGAVTLQTAALERSVQPVLLLTLDTDTSNPESGTLVYCGSAVFEGTLSDAASAAVAEAEKVIFGNHGPLPKAAFGGSLAYRAGVSVILTEEGDVAGYFDPAPLPADADIWLGQRRMETN